MKTFTRSSTSFLAIAAFSAALLGSASAGADELSPVDQVASTSVALSGETDTTSPRSYMVDASGVTSQRVVAQARKAQTPSSYELQSSLVRSPAKPEVVRALGE